MRKGRRGFGSGSAQDDSPPALTSFGASAPTPHRGGRRDGHGGPDPGPAALSEHKPASYRSHVLPLRPETLDPF